MGRLKCYLKEFRLNVVPEHTAAVGNNVGGLHEQYGWDQLNNYIILQIENPNS